MSGGAYDYAYLKIEDFAESMPGPCGCSAATPALRIAFAKHLEKVAAAMRAIEWNDSGDGDDDEQALLESIVRPEDLSDTLGVQLEELKRGVKLLKRLLTSARG